MTTRRRILSLALLAEAGCRRISPQPALARAAEFLWSNQASGGGWHSRTYGLLRSGQALTPFVLNALLRVPDAVYPMPHKKADRAIEFILGNTRSNGAVGMSEPDIPDYPNYATALSVSALCRARRDDLQKRIAPMVAYLRSRQFTQRNGWKDADPTFGAWGMGGEPRTPPDTGHVDLSMTRHVLDALRAAGVPPTDPAIQTARIFVARCQNTDGGFFFSTTESDTNKAGHDGKQFRSYGTTAADGILALVASGHSREDSRVTAAARWLTGHHRDMSVPGFEGPAYDRWPHGLAFYYAAASTAAFRAIRANPGLAVIAELERTQRPDGSWSNPENLVKEDDPFIATPFAIHALAMA
jgi:Prenyltransferase and squalene oxidase repeat